MTRKALFACIVFAAATVSLAGCDFYFGDEDDGDVRPGGDGGDNGGPGGDGWTCTDNDDCAAGCYCAADGYCEEAGFCSFDEDCPEGFECDGRASCVPEQDNSCTTDADCGADQYCDEMLGLCVDTWGCTADDQCGMGYECDDRGACVPAPCESNADCFEGCYCDTEVGECVETGTCTDDVECDEGFECNTDDSVCEPCPDGICVVACEEITTSAECSMRDDCYPAYTGTNCTSEDGIPCDVAEDPMCDCEVWEFTSCDPIDADPEPPTDSQM